MAEKPTYEELKQRVQELETDYMKLEKKMLESRSFTEEIMTYMTEGLVLTDTWGTVIFMNQRLSEMLGYLPEEIIGKCWLDLVPADQQSIAKEAEIRRAQGDTDRYEIILRHKDGHKFPVLIGAGSRFDKQSSEYLGTMGVVTDITERKQAEAALLESKERIRAIGDNLQGAQLYQLRVAPDGCAKFTYVSSKVEELHEYKPEDVLKDASLLFKRVHPADVDEWKKLSKKSIRELSTYDHTVRIVRKSGEIRWHRMISKPHKMDDGSILFDGVEIDVTERNRAEEALRGREEKYRLIFNMGVNAMFLVDNNTTQILECNNKASQLLGYSSQELLSMKMTELSTTPEATRRACQENVAKIEGVYQKKDGDLISVDITSEHFYLADRAVHISAIRDITDKKLTEKVLESNYALLQIAGETAKFGGWSVDLEKNICTWSDAVADIHDMPHGYIPPVQEAINFYAPEWQGKITQIFSACAKEGISYDEEMEIITQKGKRVWVRATGKAVKNKKDKIIKVQGSFQDITERKCMEETEKKFKKNLEKRNHFIQTILDNLPIGLAVNYIEEGTATYMNKKFEEIYGWPKKELQNIGEFFHKIYPDPEYREKLMKQILEDIKSGDPERMVWEGIEITREDGHKRIISAKNIALNEQNLMISTVQDITEKKTLQTQLSQAQKLESVGRLAGGVAHDFNNMLGVILGHTELALLQADENHELHDDLIEIQKAAKRSADITKQLLAFARKQTISPRKLDLNDTVENMLNMLRRLIGENIDLVWHPAAHLWPVKMDPTQIDQILANLCVNARDAITGVGKLIIETGKKSFDQEYCRENAGFSPGDYVMLAVSDNGCGMNKNTLDNLFEPFFTTKKVGKGTGLGLATIYGIVKQNNGFINVYSEPGRGSTFKIYLPRTYTDKNTDKNLPDKKAAVGGTETILLVEDEPSILRMTRMMLERKGYTVLTATTPAEAVEKAKSHSGAIDLLMTDVIMPEMNGRDLAEKITMLYPGISLLFMSGYTADVIANQGMLDAKVAFIQKPFSMADMTEKVREVLGMASDKS